MGEWCRLDGVPDQPYYCGNLLATMLTLSVVIVVLLILRTRIMAYKSQPWNSHCLFGIMWYILSTARDTHDLEQYKATLMSHYLLIVS